MNALILAAMPVLALLIVAIVGLLWLRQPVDANRQTEPGVDPVAQALARLEDVNRRVESLAQSAQAPARAKRDAHPRAATRAKAS